MVLLQGLVVLMFFILAASIPVSLFSFACFIVIGIVISIWIDSCKNLKNPKL